MRDSVDVAIVGGGVMGCAIAWQLVKRGVSCALVERREFGNGASGATAGVVGPLWHLDPDDRDLFRLGMRSLELFPQWSSELAEAGVNPEFQQNGVLRLAFSEDEVEELRGFLTWQSELRMDVQWLDKAQVLEQEPLCSTETLAAIFSPRRRVASVASGSAMPWPTPPGGWERGFTNARRLRRLSTTATESPESKRPPETSRRARWCWLPGLAAALRGDGHPPAGHSTFPCEG